MRDFTAGPQWDSRRLDELRWSRLRVQCGHCQHYAYVWPAELAGRHRLGRKVAWRLLIPRFRCGVCGAKKAGATVEPLPRN